MVFDATVAGLAATSYLTVEDADALAAVDPVGGEAWLSSATDEKEQALMAATADVDTYRRAVAFRYDEEQPLLFPRLEDVRGDPALPFIPRQVERATYEQATYLRQNAHLIRGAASQRARAVISASDGDGGFTAAVSPTWGLYAPKMVELLDAIGAAGRTGRRIVSVPMASSFPP